jgi:large subunit ribosomal protein L15
MPLLRRLPKRGFTPPRPRLWNVVNLRDLGRFPPGSTVDAGVLRAARLVRRPGPVKILAQGTIDRHLVVRVDAFSGTARERIVAAGGVAEQLAPRPEDAAAGAAPAAEADAGGGKQAR